MLAQHLASQLAAFALQVPRADAAVWDARLNQRIEADSLLADVPRLDTQYSGSVTGKHREVAAFISSKAL